MFKSVILSCLGLFQGVSAAPSSYSDLLVKWKAVFGDNQLEFQNSAPSPKSLVFLVPLQSKTLGLEEFYKNFAKPPVGFGYDAVFASDYYGLRGQGDDVVKSFVNRLFVNAAKFETETGITPRIIFDIEGFRANTNLELRNLIENSKYMFGWHVYDEGDAHLTGDKDVFAKSPAEIEQLLKGTLNIKYKHPLFSTYENQFGIPANRKFNYVNNTDALYLQYMAIHDKYHDGPNYFAVDYYLFNRSWSAVPTDQKLIYDMMVYCTMLVWRGNAKNHAFAWTEPTYQGLDWICNAPGNKSRPATPVELNAQIWLYWVGGQTSIRGDFNYIFNHLCLGIKGHNHEGLLHPYYTEHRKIVEAANERQRELALFLNQKSIWFLTSHDFVKCGLRFYIENNQLQVLILVVNISDQNIGQVAIVGHPVLNLLGDLQVLDETRKVKFDGNGFLIETFTPYQVKMFKL